MDLIKEIKEEIDQDLLQIIFDYLKPLPFLEELKERERSSYKYINGEFYQKLSSKTRVLQEISIEGNNRNTIRRVVIYNSLNPIVDTVMDFYGFCSFCEEWHFESVCDKMI